MHELGVRPLAEGAASELWDLHGDSRGAGEWNQFVGRWELTFAAGTHKLSGRGALC